MVNWVKAALATIVQILFITGIFYLIGKIPATAVYYIVITFGFGIIFTVLITWNYEQSFGRERKRKGEIS